jgi:hypothetical protein
VFAERTADRDAREPLRIRDPSLLSMLRQRQASARQEVAAMQSGDGAALDAHSIRPARWWYWVAGAAGVAAVVWFALGLLLGFRSAIRQVEAFQRVPIPGQAEVSFAEPGGYTLYYEGPAASDERFAIPWLDVKLAPVGGGESIPIRDYGTFVTYDFARSGRAVGSFRIEEPGRFLLQTEGDSRGGQANVAVGPSWAAASIPTIAVSIVGALLLLMAGAALAMVVAVRRGRARRVLPAPAAQPVATWRQASGPAGWFTDPGGRHEFRYWDGQRWTEHVSDRGALAIDPP